MGAPWPPPAPTKALSCGGSLKSTSSQAPRFEKPASARVDRSDMRRGTSTRLVSTTRTLVSIVESALMGSRGCLGEVTRRLNFDPPPDYFDWVSGASTGRVVIRGVEGLRDPRAWVLRAPRVV